MLERNRIFTLSGIMAPILFAGFVWPGGTLRADYSPILDTVSVLAVRGAPSRALLDAGFALSYLFIALFGFGLLRSGRICKDGYRLVTGGLLVLSGAFCFLMVLLFPADPPDSALSFAGKFHHVIAVLLALLAVVMVLFSELDFKHSFMFRAYSFASILLIVLAAAATAYARVIGLAGYQGLFERVSLGTFLQWIFFIAIKEMKVKETQCFEKG